MELGYFFSASHKRSCSRKKIPGHFQSSGSAERAGTSLDSCPIKLLTYWTFLFLCTFTLPVLHRISPCTEYSPPMSQSPDAGHTIPVCVVPICIPARSVPVSAGASPDRSCASAALPHREVRKYKCPPINEALRHILKIFPCHVCWFHLLIALLSVYPHPRHQQAKLRPAFGFPGFLDNPACKFKIIHVYFLRFDSF